MSRTIERVVLVAPPGRCQPEGTYHAVPPEGLARLAAWARAIGCEVFLVDTLIEGYDQRVQDSGTVRYGLSAERTAERIASLEPDLIGLGCTFTCIEPDVFEIAGACKSLMPDRSIIAGGAHAAINAVSILDREPSIDFVALGEGEPALAGLIDNQTVGVACRVDGTILLRPSGRFIELNEQLPPDWNLFDLDSYAKAGAPHGGKGTSSRFLPTSWSRGCVHACSFCLTPRIWGVGSYRHRSVESVVSEAEQLVRDHRIEELHLEDDCLTADKPWFLSALEALSERMPDLRLELPNGLDAAAVDRDLAMALGKAGTKRLAISLGTGPQDNTPRGAARPPDSAQGREAVRMMQDQEIRVTGFLQIGFPGQTIRDMEATVEYALSLGLDDVNFFIATPFPGTPLYALCEKNGWLVEPLDYREIRLSKGHIRTDQFGPEDTDRIRREGWVEFHRSKKGAG